LEKEHAGQTSNSQQELDGRSRSRVRRELEVAAQLLAIQKNAALEKAEKTRNDAERELAWKQQLTEREQIFNQQLQGEKEQLQRLQQIWAECEQILEQKQEMAMQTRVKREDMLLKQFSQTRQKLEDMVRIQTQRGNELSAQIVSGLSQATSEKAEVARSYAEKIQNLDNCHAQKLLDTQVQLQNVLKICEKQKDELPRQVIEIRKQCDESVAELEAKTNAQYLAFVTQSKTLECRDISIKHLESKLSTQFAECTSLRNEIFRLNDTYTHRFFTKLQKLLHLNTQNKNCQVVHLKNPKPNLVSLNLPHNLQYSSQNSLAQNESSLGANCMPVYNIAMPQEQQPQTRNVNEVQNIHQLLELDNTTFVTSAYKLILGRLPDPEGLHYYLDRLQKGYGKPSVIVQLAKSSEAVALNKNVDGLTALKIEYQRSTHWFWGPVQRRREQRRQLSKLEYELGNLAEQGRRIETLVFQISFKLNASNPQANLPVPSKELVDVDVYKHPTNTVGENQLSNSKSIFFSDSSNQVLDDSSNFLNDKKTPLERIGRQFVGT
jgi:Domain of unknown function (DUF4214)